MSAEPRPTIWFYNPADGTESESDTLSERGELNLDSDEAPVTYTQAFTFDDHFALNEQHFNALQIEHGPVRDSNTRFILKKPTASSISSKCVNPGLYTRCVGVRDLDHLAALLDAPDNWRQLVDAALVPPFVRGPLRSFRLLPNNELEVCSFA